MEEFSTLRMQINEYILSNFKLGECRDLAIVITDNVCFKLNQLKVNAKIRDFHFSWEDSFEPDVFYNGGLYRYHLVVWESFQMQPHYDIYSYVNLRNGKDGSIN